MFPNHNLQYIHILLTRWFLKFQFSIDFCSDDFLKKISPILTDTPGASFSENDW